MLLKGWCHPRKIVAFCENCFCHNLKTNKVKYIKVYISREGISRGIYLNSQIFGWRWYFLRNRHKSDLLAQNLFNKGQKIYFWTKITKNLPKPSRYMYLGTVFSLFLINFLFLKILAFLVQKSEILAKSDFFDCKHVWPRKLGKL